MNDVTLIGNLTREIEVRYTQTKKAVGQFTVAINNGKNRDGKELDADFINCVIWETQAENMQKYTKKGSKVAVKGSIKNDNYEDEQGNKKYRTYVLCRRVIFLDRKSEKPLPTEPENLGSSPVSQPEPVSDPYAEFGNEFVLDESQLPF